MSNESEDLYISSGSDVEYRDEATEDTYETDDSDYESDTSAESFSSIANALEGMRLKLEMFGDGIEAVHSSVQAMEAPVGTIAIGNLVQPKYLESAGFRRMRFGLQEGAQTLLGFQRPTVKFATLCRHLREYCISQGLVNAQGIICLNEELKNLLGTQEETTTFLGLLTHLKMLVK